MCFHFGEKCILRKRWCHSKELMLSHSYGDHSDSHAEKEVNM